MRICDFVQKRDESGFVADEQTEEAIGDLGTDAPNLMRPPSF